MKDEKTVTCPACGSVVEIESVSVIRPDSEALKDLFKGQLNVSSCDTCDAAFSTPQPLLYRDDETRTIIYYLPKSVCNDTEAAHAQIETLNAEILAELPSTQKPVCRLVLEYPHFIEKVALLQAGMDDRVVEYVKYMLIQNSNELTDEAFDLLYDFSAQKEDALVFIAFSREDHKAEYGLEFDKADYSELVEMFTHDASAADKLDELFPGHIVSVDALLAYAQEMEAADE